MFPIYIAGSWTNRQDVESIMEQFKRLGYSITHNWVEIECDNIEQRSDEQKSKCAKLDIEGVKNASALVVIMDNPKYAYRGVSCEIGCALGLGIPVLIFNPLVQSYAKSNIFYWHPDIQHFSTMDDLKEALYKINPKKVDTIDYKTAKKNSDNYKKTNTQRTFNNILKLIHRGSNKGHTYLNFRIKNKNQDIKYLTDELAKLGYHVTFEKDVINITWN